MKSLIYVSIYIYFVNLRINGTAKHLHRADMLILICVLKGFFFINIFFQMAFVI